MKRHTVRVTFNFETNLDEIRRFLDGVGAGHAFDPLLESLFDKIIPNLERFPEMGRDFLARCPLSAQGRSELEALKARLGEDVELLEYISGDYLILYAVRDPTVYLLSIKHHRQLSFDLKGHWTR